MGNMSGLRHFGHLCLLRAGADVVGPEMLVGMAQAGGGPLDQNLLLLGRIQVDLLDLPVLAPPYRIAACVFMVPTP